MIASIFPVSTAMPSLVTMCPSRVPLITPKAHLAGFRFSRAVRHRSKQVVLVRPVYRKIIQEYLHKGRNVLAEYLQND